MKRLLARKVFFLVIFFFSISAVAPPSAPAMSDGEKERRFGNLLDYYVSEMFVMLNDDAVTDRVGEVARKLMSASGRPAADVKVGVINDPLPLAFALPGNYVYVSTGLLDMLGSEEELAAALSDRIAHELKGYEYEAFQHDWSKRKTISTIFGILTVAMMVGGIALSAAAASAASAGNVAAAQSAINASNNLTSAAMAATWGMGENMARDVPEQKVALNRAGPHLMSPSLAEKSCVISLFKDVYEGYDEKKELETVDEASGLLRRAGYDPGALARLYSKMLAARGIYQSKGYVSSLMCAKPVLEKKIEHADGQSHGS